MAGALFYYLDKNQTPQGPVTLDALRRLAGADDLSYCIEGEIEWLSFAKHPPPDESVPQKAAQPPPPPSIAGTQPPPVPAPHAARQSWDQSPLPLPRQTVPQPPDSPSPPVAVWERLARIEGAKFPPQSPKITADTAPAIHAQTNWMAVTGFVFSLCTLFALLYFFMCAARDDAPESDNGLTFYFWLWGVLGIPSAIFSAIGLCKKKTKGLAIAGLALSLVFIVMFIIFIILGTFYPDTASLPKTK